MNESALKVWFEEVIAYLKANGNKIAGPMWIEDKEGQHCLMTKPIDTKIIKSQFKVPRGVTLSAENGGSIKTNTDFLQISFRTAFGFYPPPQSTNNVRQIIWTWTPFYLVSDTNQSAMQEQILPLLKEAFTIEPVEFKMAHGATLRTGYLDELNGNTYEMKGAKFPTWFIFSQNEKAPHDSSKKIILRAVFPSLQFPNKDARDPVVAGLSLICSKLNLQLWDDQEWEYIGV